MACYIIQHGQSSAIITPETIYLFFFIIFFLFVSFSIAVVSDSALSLKILKIQPPPPQNRSGGCVPLTAPPPEYAPGRKLQFLASITSKIYNNELQWAIHVATEIKFYIREAAKKKFIH